MTLETLNFWKISTVKNLFILCTFLLLGCKSYKTTTELESTFSKQEIKDIQTIRTFFIKDILSLNDENFNTEFRHRIVNLEAEGFKSVKPKKIDKLFSSVSKSTFDEIWETKTQKRSRNSDDTYQYYAPKINGKYKEFLSLTTKHNSMVNKYYNNILRTEDFSHSSMLNYIADNTLDFDLNNTNVQIVMAIHYISICNENNITNQLIN
ncbi:hypothetical protein DFQ10_107158 [Winogradskyella eximia]|uniref:Uncharacterized protein n=1 Tax=Winogradskyella eximia TaxID=262006 RepID=A0A3D9H1D5_9FLAO|nr:hypothetical protein [Winogradskyella eximia]RED42971.1 hypothetical protein DFQ10_107158 [Winogradskyella eximia]